MLTGDSSGGNVAAATSLKLRDSEHPVKLRYQVLIYPTTQGITFNLPSHQENEHHMFHVISRKSLAEFYTCYVGKTIIQHFGIYAIYANLRNLRKLR